MTESKSETLSPCRVTPTEKLKLTDVIMDSNREYSQIIRASLLYALPIFETHPEILDAMVNKLQKNF